ncbi:hypothetical protein D1Y84_10485 [Acidipila sp. EB88]|nr:hypothetical protein D1Y84_10485 [Acidipila sp. EB88]
MPYRIPSATLDYLDADHLLFTFHSAKLMRREPDEPLEDQDQTVHALVLSLPTGKVTAEGTWRLHDRERYLWVLGNGHFLMRQRDTLYIGDSSLVLSTYLHPEGKLASVQLSPDNSTLIVQYANEVKDDEQNALGDTPPHSRPTLGPGPTLGPSPSASSSAGTGSTGNPDPNDAETRFPQRRKEYTLLSIDVARHSATRLGVVHRPLAFTLVQDGYLGVAQGNGKLWDVKFARFGQEPEHLNSVTSTCQPLLLSVSPGVFLAQSCLPYSSDHLVQAFDLHGHKLWEQVWQSRFVWGTFAYSDAGNRFAYGSIEVNHDLATLDPVEDGSILGEPVGVFSIASGKLDTVLDATPILTAGENFSLSPDGNTLAILREGAIELYPLPSAAPPPAVTASSK